jgi:hypothetical protein
MPLASVLLFSMVLSAPVALLQPTPPVGAETTNYFANDAGAIPAQSFQLSPSTKPDDIAVTPSDNVCYKIRAYIFKQDDDRPPEFVRSTTCGPNKQHTKDAIWPKARVVPAD